VDRNQGLIDQADFFGRGISESITSDKTLVNKSDRVQFLDPDSGRTVNLPDATTMRLGGPQFYICNNSGSNTLDVDDDGGSLVVTIPVDSAALIILDKQNDANGLWFAMLFNIEGVRAGRTS